ncbi:MAG: aminotransferase class IV [Candidatus Omnitrophica bacterium]|nr:aminotransferase class IV [Candidatus Omnitrophota bacterium]
MNKVWLNKKIIDAESACIPISDRGFMYGDGVFETMRSYSGMVFKIDAHLDRLFNSLKVAKFSSPYAKDYLKREIYRLLDANRLKEAYIRLMITRGEGRFGMEHKDRFIPNTVIVVKEFHSYPARVYAKGITAGVVDIRQNELSPVSGIKSLNFINYILARFEAKEKGYDEAILANSRGHIAEATTSNIFMVKGMGLITPSPDSGILPGITRMVVMQLARRRGIFVKEMAVTRRELYNSDEIFLTNSLSEVLPVVAVDGKRIGRGVPGETTRLLHSLYRKETSR